MRFNVLAEGQDIRALAATDWTGTDWRTALASGMLASAPEVRAFQHAAGASSSRWR